MSIDWDVIFAGTGLAALAVAARLAALPRPPRMLLVDRHHDDQPAPPTPLPLVGDGPGTFPRRTFSCWIRGAHPLDPVVRQRFDALAVRAGGRDLRWSCAPWTYAVLDDGDLRAVRLAAARAAGAAVVRGRVEAIRDHGDAVTVEVDGRAHRARHVLDSRWTLPPAGGAALRQAFEGAWIETDTDAFDPGEATLIDMAPPYDLGTGPDVRFLHVIPDGRRRALVMLVAIGADPEVDLPPLPGRVLRREGGVTPMDPRPPVRRPSARVLRLGVAGGLLKASTGYALTRMEADADAIAASWARHGHPFDLPRPRCLPRALDALMLRVMARRPAAVGPLFGALFAGNPASRLVPFLDGEAGWRDSLRLGLTLPLAPFLAVARPRLPIA